MSSGPVGRCTDLVKVFDADTGSVVALAGVDVEVRPGEVTVLIGPSGSGKSTLLAMLGLRDTPTAGAVTWDGRPADDLTRRERADLRRRILWVTQRPAAALFPHLSAERHVAQTMRATGAEHDDPAEVLDRVGLLPLRSTPTRFLSGGEQQRLAVVSAAVTRPDVLIADEPTAELDDHSSGLVFDQLHALAEHGSTVVVATHDARVRSLATRVVEMRDGILVAEGVGDGALRARIDSRRRVELPPAAVAALGTEHVDITVTEHGVLLTPARPA
ncbi:MAG: ABC transporter ATP-binding protein [Jatrophihabitans sp.]|uniref:ABC transporter ATP-binding protein n=1 Tax=Jatrophihabitans sp. TaxID=1932789 RepID=UPI003F7E29C0